MIGQVRGHMDAGSDGNIRVELPIGDDTSVTDVHKMCTTDSRSCSQPRDACTDIFLLEHGYYQDEPASKLLLIPHTGTFCCFLVTTIAAAATSVITVLILGGSVVPNTGKK